MDDLSHYDLIECWHFRITRKKADGAFQCILHEATIKWFNNTYFEGTIIQLQNNDSFKVLSGYASNGPFNIGTMSFDVTADDGSVRKFYGNIIDERSIFGSCTSKGENKHGNDKSQWFALRYKKIPHDVEEEEDEEEDPICPYCKRKSSEGGCEHEIANTDPDLFDLDLEYPLMSKAYADIEWPEKTLHKIFGNLRDVLDAHGDDCGFTLDLSKKPNVIRYFEELMKKISCDYETRGYEYESGGPASSYCGVIYYAENPDEVHKQLNKTIQRLKRCFKKLEDKMNKGHLGCPYCGADYKKAQCMHYVTNTDLVNYPILSEEFKDKKWLQENLRKTFRAFYDVLDAYEHGLTKEPNRIVYLKKLLEKISNCELKYYQHEETLVVFAIDKEEVLKNLNELEKRLSWLFRGLAYAEGIEKKGNTKGRK